MAIDQLALPRHVIGTSLMAFLLFAGSPANAESLCDRIKATFALPADSLCAENGAVAVIAPKTDAEKLLILVQEARTRFEGYFSTATTPLVLIIGQDLNAAETSAFARRDLLVLPWPTFAARIDDIEKSISDQITAKFPTLDEARRKSIVAQLLAKFQSSGDGPGSLSPLEAGVIQHEMGHLWFSRFYDGQPGQTQRPAGPAGYGSSAPDWLDEIPAILVENEVLAGKRREGLQKLLVSNPAGALSLSGFFASAHPVRIEGRPTGGGSSVTIRLTAAGGASEARLLDYYTLSRAFADFLLETSGNKAVFQDLAGHVRSGGTVQAWLGVSGEANGLGSSLGELDAHWARWLQAKRSPPG